MTDALDDMVAKSADLVFLEGFTDMAENAAYWRSTDNIYYDFPNQRLNILRKYSSSRAWAESFRVEMEACDYFFDVSAKNSGNQYRTGSLDVAKIAGVAPDKNTEWYVTSTEAGEWMEWKELPYAAGDITVKVCYAAKEDAKIRFDFGEGTKKKTRSCRRTSCYRRRMGYCRRFHHEERCERLAPYCAEHCGGQT